MAEETHLAPTKVTENDSPRDDGNTNPPIGDTTKPAVENKVNEAPSQPAISVTPTETPNTAPTTTPTTPAPTAPPTVPAVPTLASPHSSPAVTAVQHAETEHKMQHLTIEPPLSNSRNSSNSPAVSPPSSPPGSPSLHNHGNIKAPFPERKASVDSGNESNGHHDEKKKQKFNLWGWLKKEMRLNKEKGDTMERTTSGKERLPRQVSSAHIENKGSGPDKPHGDKPPEESVPDNDANARKIIVVEKLEDFPEECQKWIKQSGIPREKLEANFRILMNVLHFRSGKIFKTQDMLNDPPRPLLPKSTRIKRGEDLVTDALEFKKLYKDLEELGKGGFGTVWHARSIRDKKKPVAIKRMEHKTKKQKSANFHEVSILSFCNHPNIVRYITCHEIKDELWVVMELMEGGTFEDAAKAWHFSESNIAYIARELLKGIAYMHASNLAHRDLKSANIMMSVRGEVKIIDLGLCADLSVGFPTHMVGSPFWMPPEMIQCKPHNTAVDIWSFAISLLEIANQRPPMIESAVKAMFTVGTEGVKDYFVEPSKWSDVFRDFLGTCLKMDAEERATAESLLNHPFIKLADSRANMENILRRIFLSNSLLNSGF